MSSPLLQKLASASFFMFGAVALNSCEAIGFVRGQAAVQKAQIAKARVHVHGLVVSVHAYRDDYNAFPAIAPGLEEDLEITSGPKLIDVLLGFDGENNPKRVRYFQAGDAVNGHGGLVFREDQQSAKLIDPWGQEYFVLFDSDYDDELAEPFTGKALEGRSVIAWSAGPNGRTNPDPAHKDNADNIYSWK